MNRIGKIVRAMIAYDAGDVRRIRHFLKVYGYAKTIGELEGLDGNTQEILEIAAITHDIGIKNSEIKYRSSAGNYQQLEGPSEAQTLLEGLGIETGAIDRVCWLIAHHHTYTDIRGLDYQILVEADFLVNFDEDAMPSDEIHRVGNKIFRTPSGKELLNLVYG